MTEQKENSGISIPMIIPWILALITAFVGIWHFTQQQREANQEPFLKKQLELSFDASETVAKLATETNSSEWEKARMHFWQLYWGSLSAVENRTVEAAMVVLGQIVPDHPIDSSKLPMSCLRGPSYYLSHTLRDLVLASWNVQLPALQDDRLKRLFGKDKLRADTLELKGEQQSCTLEARSSELH